MFVEKQATERKQGYCSLCISRCGSIGVIENGRLVALEPDPSHPTGKALCAKGRAAPELGYHPGRLLYPMKRTRPKGEPDPGWQRISWEEALDLTAANLKKIAAEHGPESVVFTVSSPSTSASDDSTAWLTRLVNAFGSPNLHHLRRVESSVLKLRVDPGVRCQDGCTGKGHGVACTLCRHIRGAEGQGQQRGCPDV